MKKVYLLFVASIAMIASAFAADLQIDATKQYQLKFTMEASAAGNIYAKAMAVGDDNNFIDIGGGTTAANPVLFAAGTQTYTSPLNNPIGSPTAFNHLQHLIPYCLISHGHRQEHLKSMMLKFWMQRATTCLQRQLSRKELAIMLQIG